MGTRHSVQVTPVILCGGSGRSHAPPPKQFLVLSGKTTFKRAEHWVVVKGIAEVICQDKKITLKENESTYIPLGYMHRISNIGNEILEIIEVQSGNYLGEDDIVRFDDKYGRN
jgi:mannose-1-phosphate guanylyltransferase/mannose-6-phosphate isomerase